MGHATSHSSFSPLPFLYINGLDMQLDELLFLPVSLLIRLLDDFPE
jgi:hypothetical protein